MTSAKTNISGVRDLVRPVMACEGIPAASIGGEVRRCIGMVRYMNKRH